LLPRVRGGICRTLSVIEPNNGTQQ